MGCKLARLLGYGYSEGELYDKIKQGRDRKVKKILKRNKSLRGCIFASGENVMTAVVANRCYKSLCYLSAKGVDVNSYDANGRTPLQTACCHGDLDMLKLLLDRAADTELACLGHLKFVSYHNSDILSLCKSFPSKLEMSDNYECLAKIRPNTTYFYVTFPILETIVHSQMECTQILLTAGAKLDVRDRVGNTPLLIATMQNCTQAVELLLDEIPCMEAGHNIDLDATNKLGVKPLNYATFYSNEVAVECLIKHGCKTHLYNTVSPTDPSLLYRTTRICPNDPPLYQAACLRNLKIVKQLIESGASAKVVLPIFLARRIASSGNPTPFLDTEFGETVLKVLVCNLYSPMDYMLRNPDIYEQFNEQITIPAIRGEKWDLLSVVYDVGIDISDGALAHIRDNEHFTQWRYVFPKPRKLKSFCRLLIRHILNDRINTDIEYLNIPSEIKKYVRMDYIH